MEEYYCDFCEQTLYFKKYQQFGAHRRNCKQNPEHEEIISKLRNDKNSYTLQCSKCGNDYTLELTEAAYKSGRYRKTCSSKCAHSRNWSKNDKKKKSKALKQYSQKRSQEQTKKWKQIYKNNPNFCKICGKELPYNKRKRSTCSTNCLKQSLSKAGRKSAAKQQEKRRSKNEKYFAELCKNEFEDVLTNKRIFNDWDADVIIKDHKIAVLWNGLWHYKEITKEHSLEQVKNRDLLKRREIKDCGYYPYTIKDVGRNGKEFVKNKFKMLLKFIENSNDSD